MQVNAALADITLEEKKKKKKNNSCFANVKEMRIAMSSLQCTCSLVISSLHGQAGQ